MGASLLDRFSLLHFATGIVAYFMGASFWQWFIIHGLFELLENSQSGMDFIRTNFSWFWPGGKEFSDAPINMLGDQAAAMAGWVVPWLLFGPVSKFPVTRRQIRTVDVMGIPLFLQ